jgi:Ca2+-transporting ATPase
VQGLTEQEAQTRLEEYGSNEIRRVDKFKAIKLVLEQFRDPLVLLLLAAATLSYFVGEVLDATLIISIVLLNGFLGFFQESKAEKTIEGIQERIKAMTRLLRGGEVKELESGFIVPGDVIILEAGDKVPADCRIVSGEINVDESMLTGESLPVFKTPGDSVFAGTLVVKGNTRAEVTATGMNTRIGGISKLSEGQTPTPFQRKLRRLSAFLGKAVVVISVLIAAFGISQGRAVLEMVELGISLGVAAVPEGLIILSTMCLAIGVKRMADRKAIVKRLPAVEALGSVDVLCVDKTGTITENRLVVKESHGNQAALKVAAALTSQEFKDPMDIAFREWAGSKRPGSFEPFDSDKKFARSFLKGQAYVKGAPEVVSKLCKELPASFEKDVHDMASRGLKVIALASGTREGRLEFHGLVGLYDPPRKGVEQVIATAKELGIAIKMITGDHPETARAIARQVGITGKVVDFGVNGFSEDEVAEASVFARVAPEDKLRIVQALQKQGLKVGMTGDGVNDAPALKKSDIGIALGSGTEIAKEAADIVLLDDNLSTIVEAAREGRSVFVNVRKATQYLLGMNAAEILAISAGMFFGTVMFKPAQILWMNLVTDSLPALAFAYDRNPIRGKNKNILTGELWRNIGVVGAVLAAATVGSFLGWGKVAALNTLIYAEIGYQQIIRRKYHSRGLRFSIVFLLATVAVQLAATQFLGTYLGLGFPGIELVVVGGALAVLAFT